MIRLGEHAIDSQASTDAPLILMPADVFLTRGAGRLSALIRFFTRGLGEARTKVNHVGLIVRGGGVQTATAVEALSHVERHPLWARYGPPSTDLVAVYRATNLTEGEIARIVAAAERYVDRKYGYLKLVAHLADWTLLGVYLFRRLARMDRYPICSWLVAHAFAKARRHFGVAPGAATPDDIWDFIQRHRQIYQEIHPLKRLR